MIRTVELGEEMQDNGPSHSLIHIKWNHFGTLRRFHITEVVFNKLMEKIWQMEPMFSHGLCYADEDGDKIVFSSTTEMDEMVAHFRQLRVSTIKIESIEKRESKPAKVLVLKKEVEMESPNPSLNKTLHPNILCDKCDSSVKGIRYKCVTCDDFDLCENCEKTGAHAEHPMLRLATPDTPKLFEVFHHMNRRQKEHQKREERRLARQCSGVRTGTFGCLRPVEHSTQQMLMTAAEPTHPVRFDERRQHIQNLQQVRKSFLAKKSNNTNGVIHKNNVPVQNTNAPVLQPQVPAFNGFSRHRTPNGRAEKSVLGDNNKFHQKMEYLKEIGSQVQQALLNFGIECEATVEDAAGRVHGRVPLKQQKNESQEQEAKTVKRKSAEKLLVEEETNKYPKKGESSKQQQSEHDSPFDSLSAAIHSATNDTIQLASQISMEALNTASEIIGSLDQQIGERYGSSVLSNVKKGTESFANTMSPLIADLSDKCKIGSDSVPQAESAPKMYPNLNDEVLQAPPQQQHQQVQQQDINTDRATNLVLNECLTNFLNSISQNEAIQASAPEESKQVEQPAVEEVMEVNEEQLVDVGSDVEILQEMSPESNDLDNEINLSRSTSNSESSDNFHMDEDEEWMLVSFSKSSYKHLCDFYEKQRKAKTVEEEEEEDDVQMGTSSQFAQPRSSAPPANAPPQDLQSLTSSISSSQPLVADHEIIHLPVAETQQELPSSLVQATQAAAAVMDSAVNNKCYAGMPYYNPMKPHNKICYVRHKDPVVQGAVDRLEAMGYDNCNGWLTRISEKTNGDIERILDQAIEDPLYLARLAD